MSSTGSGRRSFTVSRRHRTGVDTGGSFADVLPDWKGRGEVWLFISPHDDDIVAGGGLLLQKAVEDGVRISVRITTNGDMGYCSLSDRDRIVEIRRDETLESFGLYGITDVEWLGFSDNDLYRYAGRRAAVEDDPSVIAGYTGIQNAYTHLLRSVRPSRVFVPGRADYHPDHKLVYQEVLISIFHAGGAIWPELGAPLEALPSVYEMAVYCAFEENPDIKVKGGPEHLETKIRALQAYRSQKQIGSVIVSMREAGPVEYVRDIGYRLYSPSLYEGLF